MQCVNCGNKFDGRVYNNKSYLTVNSGFAGKTMRILIIKDFCPDCNEKIVKQNYVGDMKVKAEAEDDDREAQQLGYDNYTDMISELETDCMRD